jgi:hypothetical protein
MRITGPDWPSTIALQQALQDTPGPSFPWGQGSKDGLQQLEAFAAAGIPCPTFTTEILVAKEWERQGLRTFGRLRRHSQGRDIVEAEYRLLPQTPEIPAHTRMRWVTTRRGNRVQRPRLIPRVPPTIGGEHWNPKWLRREFWVQVLPSVEEYRQHIFNGKAIRSGKKTLVGPQVAGPLVRSRRRNWHLNYGEWTRPADLKDLAKRAVSVLGYTQGALDILQDSSGKLWVLEVNSAPSLQDQNTLKVYVEEITQWAASHQEPR